MSLVRRGHAVLFAKLVAVAASYGLIALLSARLDRADFGRVSFFLSLSVLISVIGARGQHMALLRFLPGAGAGAGALVRAAAIRARTATFALFGLTLGAGSALGAAGAMPGYDPGLLALGAGLGLAVAWADFISHRARAQGQLMLSILPKEVIWRVAAILSVWALLPAGAGAAAALAILIAVLTSVNLATTARLPVACAGGSVPDGWRRASGPFWIGSVSNIFLANADTAAVALLVGPVEAGYYFVANRLAQVLGYFMVSQNVVIAPEIARAHNRHDIDGLATIARRATRAMCWPTLGAATVLWLSATPLLALFGADFVQALPVLIWLILAACLNAATGPGDIVLNMAGQERTAMRIATGSLAASAVLLALGAWLGGGEGVAIAVLVATAGRKGAYLLALKARLGLRVDLMAGAPV